MIVTAVPLMNAVAVAGCFISPYPIHLVTGSVDPGYLVPATFKAAAWEGVAAGLFMVGCAINFVRKSSAPESWAEQQRYIDGHVGPDDLRAELIERLRQGCQGRRQIGAVCGVSKVSLADVPLAAQSPQ